MSSKQLYCLQLTNSFDDRDNYSSVIIAWQEISLTMAVVRGNMSWLDSGSIGFEVGILQTSAQTPYTASN